MPWKGTGTPPVDRQDRTARLNGSVRRGYEGVAEEFERNLAERGEVGAAFAAFVDGEPVVDVWGGWADRRRDAEWRGDTLSPVFSGTKGLVAVCLLILIDRGELDLEAPVCRYWPEFAANGKERVLVRHVVAHQAGLPGLETPVSVEEAVDDVRMARLLARQPGLTAPGAQVAYHAITFGWLCGELIRRVDGRSVGRLLREEIADRLCLDLWIGLPEEHEHRVAVVEPGEGFGAPRQTPAAADGDARTAWSIWDNPPRFSGDGLAANSPLWHAAQIPATNGVCSARSLARLYGCLAGQGEIDGVRLLSRAAVETGRRLLARGRDPQLDTPMAFGVGFQLQTEQMAFGPPRDAFGHGGAGGSMHGAWPGLRTGFSYTPSLLRAISGRVDDRAAALLGALHRAVTESSAARAGRRTEGVPRLR